MKQRCYNKNEKNYGGYGGRGIKVCDRWRDHFAMFIQDMGPRPSPQHSLDRIDVNGDYCPENCRWATQAEQQQNRRVNILLKFNGKVQCLAVWARELGIGEWALASRIRRGWSIERALTTPVNPPCRLAPSPYTHPFREAA